MNTTVRIKQSQVYKDWHVIDAADRPLGRVATEAASLLKGKHKPTYEPHLDDGDFVIVVNASQVRVTGNKAQQMTYYRHSGYPGGLKSRSYSEQMEKFPERVLEQAIWGMLPKGPLGKKMFKHLKVYRGPSHPHQSQIASTANDQEARKAAAAELVNTPLKMKGLRPLSIRQVIEVESDEPKAKAPSPAAAAARKARARVRGAEAEAIEAPAIEEPTAAEETPKRAPRKSAAEAVAENSDVEATTAEAHAAEAPKRAPRRKAAEAPEADAPAAEAPKRAPRKKAAEADSATADAPAAEKKPRSRAAAKPEGSEE